MIRVGAVTCYEVWCDQCDWETLAYGKALADACRDDHTCPTPPLTRKE